MVQIIELLGNKKALKLLYFLSDHSSESFSYTELAAKTKLARATLSKWLRFLVQMKLILVLENNSRQGYGVNRKHPFVKQLRLIRTLSWLNSLTELKAGIYLFGSAARGEDTVESDMDLLVIGNLHKEEIIAKTRKIEKKYRRKIQLQVFTLQEWVRMGQKDPAFFQRVEKDKVMLTWT